MRFQGLGKVDGEISKTGFQKIPATCTTTRSLLALIFPNPSHCLAPREWQSLPKTRAGNRIISAGYGYSESEPALLPEGQYILKEEAWMVEKVFGGRWAFFRPLKTPWAQNSCPFPRGEKWGQLGVAEWYQEESRGPASGQEDIEIEQVSPTNPPHPSPGHCAQAGHEVL